MSSRNAFTSNYIYKVETVNVLASKLERLGYGITAHGETDVSSVVGMIKNVDYYRLQLDRVIEKAIEEAIEETDYNGEVTLVFIGDEHQVIRIFSSHLEKYRCDLYT